MAGRIVKTSQGKPTSYGVGRQKAVSSKAINPKPTRSTRGFGAGDIYNKPGSPKGMQMPVKSIPGRKAGL